MNACIDRSFLGFLFMQGIFLLLLILGGCWVWRLMDSPMMGIDDACIFFEYARNIAAGKGVTYGGNVECVEGCTSLLWLGICTLCYWLKLGTTGIFTCSCVCFVGTQLIWFKLLYEMFRKKTGMPLWVLVVYIMMILMSPAYLAWMSFTLMDSSLWGLMVAVSVSAVLSNRADAKWLLPVWILLPWTRPETIFIVPFLLLVGILWGVPFRRALVWGGGFVLSIVVLEIFRMSYFGYPLPNTYYAKVSPSFFYNLFNGLDYVKDWFVSGGTVALLIFLIMLLCCTRRNETRQVNVYGASRCAILLFIFMLPTILAGGDHFCYGRFFQPFYPLVCMMVSLATCSIVEGHWGGRGKQLWFVVLAFFLGCVFAFSPSWNELKQRNELKREFQYAADGFQAGKMLDALFKGNKPPRLGVMRAGGIALGYSGRIVDLMGLNNVAIAHAKGDRRGYTGHAAFEPTMLPDLEVDCILTEISAFSEMVFKGLLTQSSFAEAWQYGRFVKEGVGAGPEMFVRKSFLNRGKTTLGVEFRDSRVWDGRTWTSVSSSNR